MGFALQEFMVPAESLLVPPAVLVSIELAVGSFHLGGSCTSRFLTGTDLLPVDFSLVSVAIPVDLLTAGRKSP